MRADHEFLLEWSKMILSFIWTQYFLQISAFAITKNSVFEIAHYIESSNFAKNGKSPRLWAISLLTKNSDKLFFEAKPWKYMFSACLKPCHVLKFRLCLFWGFFQKISEMNECDMLDQRFKNIPLIFTFISHMYLFEEP